MMDQVEKITFLYPTLIRPGMPVHVVYYPDVIIKKTPGIDIYPIMFTAGMVFNSAEVYITEIDVFFNGITVTANNNTSGEAQIKMHDLINDNQVVYISSMHMNVILQQEGLYTATIKLFKTNNGEKFGDPVDERSCNFIVPSFKDDK